MEEGETMQQALQCVGGMYLVLRGELVGSW